MDKLINMTKNTNEPEAYRLFRLQITREITSSPEWVEIMAFSETEAQTKYYALNPSHFIIWTKEVTNN